jgi:ketosteroid isomerase-like protein
MLRRAASCCGTPDESDPKDTSMNQSTAFAHIRKVFAALDGKEVSVLSDLMTDDIRLRLGNQPTTRGKRAYVAAVDAFLESVTSFRHEILTLWDAGNAVIAELNVHYVRLDGGEVTLPCCNVFELRDGLVSDYRSYIDINPGYQ